MKYALIILGIILCFKYSQSCSCLPYDGNFQKIVNDYSNIFRGTITAVTLEEMHYKITFKNIISYKGSSSESTVYTTARDSATCGFNFKSNTEYLVYSNSATVGLCSPTKEFSSTSEQNKEILSIQDALKTKVTTKGDLLKTYIFSLLLLIFLYLE